MGYKHGIYGERVSSKEYVTTSTNVPVYVGVAPVHRVKGEVNKPILIKNLEDAETKLGYRSDDDFEKFSLSAVIYAHFENKIQNIGPVVVVNVLDTKGIEISKSINIINGIGIINEDVVKDSVIIEGKILNEDYKLEYIENGIKIICDKLQGEVNVTYKKIDVSSIKEEDIIGKYDTENELRTGIKCIDDVYEELNMIPSILSSPGYNQMPKVEQALVASTSKIADRWEAVCYVDIDSNVADTREKAKNWKKENRYNSNNEKVLWPKVKVGEKEIWMSICAIVAKMQTDALNDGIPYETASNKQIDITGLIANKKKIKMSLNKANELNEKGITTSIFTGGKYVLWGPHMGNYEYGTRMRLEEIFDVNIMTNKYLLNDFNLRNFDIIDSPIARHDIDALLNSEQMILNSLSNTGKILYGEIKFEPKNNPKADVLSGDFIFDTLVTNTPPSKSITNKIQYTSVGANKLYGGDE